MSIKPLIILPDPLLRMVSKPIERVDSGLLKFADDMLDTMYDAPGIGLAAIQIGVPKRVVTLDVAKRAASEQEQDEGAEDADGAQEKRDAQPRSPMAFINPQITWSSEERSVYEEGCLSIPEYYEEVERPAAVKVSYTDLDGKRQEIEADGLLATCLQHEIDHLNGVLFIDHLSRLKRERVTKRFAKQAKRDGVA
jgi:peptide deformylase